MKRSLASLALLLFLLPLKFTQAQGTVRKHFLYFTDKANTPYSISRPQEFLSPASLARRARQNIAIKPRDLPVNPGYVSALKNAGATVLYTSKWFNGAVVLCDSAKLQTLLSLPFVKVSYTLNRSRPGSGRPEPVPVPVANARTSANRSDYGIAYRQAEMIGATEMHDAGFRGEGMTIAVFDSGFPGVDQVLPFSHLFQNNQIKGTFDFIDRDNYVFERNSHGTMTFSTIGAYLPGTFIGTAPKANFYLFITEDVQSEHPVEETNWLLAAEFADSVGVDVINSSLGYSDFDFPSRSYSYADMNGRNAISTRAADIAAAVGMLVVNSAGNEGQSGWHYITAPADGDSVLAVGAVDSLGNKMSFSSFGPSADGRIKPNLAAQGGLSAVVFPGGGVGRNNGTSFSSPILCGMAAGFWQANRNLTNMEVINFLQKSASQATNPDDRLGYGIPNFSKAHKLVNNRANTVTFYPNPLVPGPINLVFSDNSFGGEVQFKIFDRIGRLVDEQVFQKTMNQGVSVTPVSGLNAGLYFVQISWDGQQKTLPLLRLP